jgi:hypothetical protein
VEVEMKRVAMSIAVVLLMMEPIFAGTATLTQPNGFALLGISCGGDHVSTFTTGFQTDESGATTGVVGEVYVWTRCGGSGRGGGYTSHTYRKWALASWDLSGNLTGTFAWPADLPTPTSAYDEWSG